MFDKDGNWHEGEVREEAQKPTIQLPDFPKLEPLEYNANTIGFAEAGSTTVDIILPVYRGLNVVKECIESIVLNTHKQYNLIVVDDCSQDPTLSHYLETMSRLYGFKVLVNETNRGFASSVNRGIRAGSGAAICVLNSDVVVTPGWLTKMLAALYADPSHQIVNPCTNNTAEIAIPMAPGFSYLEMNKALERHSVRSYPEIMPTGFCFMFRRILFDDLGGFDESFVSYGEETDFWMRTLKCHGTDSFLGYKAVLADDTYVFHERGGSFSQLEHYKHMGHRQHGNALFKARHDDYVPWLNMIRKGGFDYVKDIRPKKGKSRYNIAWLVTSTAFCGAMQYIADIVNYLNEVGVNAQVIRIKRSPDDEDEVLPSLRSAPLVFDHWKLAASAFPFSKGYVVAGTAELIPLANLISNANPGIKSIHHIQSLDEAIAAPVDAKKIRSIIGTTDYTISSSHWIEERLRARIGKESPVATPGVNKALYHPRDRSKGDSRPTLLIFANPKYNFRGGERAGALVSVLLQMHDSNHDVREIRVIVVGADQVRGAPGVTCLGTVSPGRLADLLGSEVDLVLDPSEIHSYGLPIAEALSSGVPVVSWENGAEREIQHPKYKVWPKDAPVNMVAEDILETLYNCDTKEQRVDLLPGADRGVSCEVFVEKLEEEIGQNSGKEITIVSPHLRKYGGPTTFLDIAEGLRQKGHEVKMKVVYDYAPTIVRATTIPLNFNWQSKTEEDVLIVNSDSDKAEFLFNNSDAKKKILLKLSHNPRFKVLEEQSLNLPWDHIMTSTQWLKNVCLKTANGWNHKTWPADKVTVVGWRHYAHELFDRFGERSFKGSEGVRIGTLVHRHPLKGSNEALNVLLNLREEYGSKVKVVAVGEVPGVNKNKWLKYHYSPSREEMAEAMAGMDIWLSCSHSEGLGRMNLEAMSAGAAVVTTNTGAEFLRDGVNCLFIKTNDIDDGIAKIKYLIENPDVAMKLRMAGYQTATTMANTSYIENIQEVINA